MEHTGFHGIHRALHDCGDFLAGMADVIGQLQHHALLVGQFGGRRAQPLAQLGGLPGLLELLRDLLRIDRDLGSDPLQGLQCPAIAYAEYPGG